MGMKQPKKNKLESSSTYTNLGSGDVVNQNPNNSKPHATNIAVQANLPEDITGDEADQKLSISNPSVKEIRTEDETPPPSHNRIENDELHKTVESKPFDDHQEDINHPDPCTYDFMHNMSGEMGALDHLENICYWMNTGAYYTPSSHQNDSSSGVQVHDNTSSSTAGSTNNDSWGKYFHEMGKYIFKGPEQ
ncbi:unnamed protein product [Ilex paraguariensis]|uniref:Uncharacterized protein n=1 Tax=Ilex paraguariensis TaxID=185542 RepID=A0ABC8RKQ8_9AQUA